VASDSEPKRDRWRARIKRFEERQRKAREWINFEEIAQWCSEEDFPPNENKRAWAFDLLATDLLDGEFHDSRPRVHFLHHYTAKRVTPEWFKDVIDYDWDHHDGRFILSRCWFPRRFFKRWLARHRLEKSPPRFEPLNEPSLVRLKKPERKRPKSGRGAKTRGIVGAIKQLWPDGIPKSLTAKDRDQAIIEQIKRNEGSVPTPRTIQRVLERRSR
jgi:hypothetical protein